MRRSRVTARTATRRRTTSSASSCRSCACISPTWRRWPATRWWMILTMRRRAMSDGPKFFQTRMGQQFYDGTMPRLVRAIERVVDWLDVTTLTADDCDLVAQALDIMGLNDVDPHR